MTRLLVAIAAAWAAAACETGVGEECVAGAVAACSCGDAETGLTECQAGTLRFGECFCGPLGIDRPDAAAPADAGATDARAADARADAAMPEAGAADVPAADVPAADAPMADVPTSTATDAQTSTTADGGSSDV